MRPSVEQSDVTTSAVRGSLVCHYCGNRWLALGGAEVTDDVTELEPSEVDDCDRKPLVVTEQPGSTIPLGEWRPIDAAEAPGWQVKVVQLRMAPDQESQVPPFHPAGASQVPPFHSPGAFLYQMKMDKQ